MLEIGASDLKRADRSVVGDRVCNLAFPQLEPQRACATRPQRLFGLERDLTLLRQRVAFTHQVDEHRPSANLFSCLDTD